MPFAILKVNNYYNVKKGQFRYLFFVVGNQTHKYLKIQELFECYFANYLGDTAALVTSFSEDKTKNYESLLSKKWPKGVKKVIDSFDTKLLAIQNDFRDFNPVKDKFILVNIDNYSREIDQVEELLSTIAKIVQEDKDLFQWWEKNALGAKKMARTILKSLPAAIEAKPGIFGFSFDLKKFFHIDSLINR